MHCDVGLLHPFLLIVDISSQMASDACAVDFSRSTR
jgi:hypothetical protein